MESQRPDPELLLRQIKSSKKQRGKLKIFFGACAGAGKTYAMLLSAHEKMKEHQTVVAGVIETHGRTETTKLLEGVTRLPLKEIQYQGITLKEFDIDTALSSNPDILLIDELAHTNTIGSRHPKRWQDVEEILNAGIDVYTTLNVQHLESLNDTVTNITGIRVKETVPDSIFDNADEIVLIDIPSEAILERLAEGKVYLGEFAKQRAAQNFFKMENLIALREIALRRTAERVDALRDVYQKYKNKRQLIAEKILVCINAKSISTKMIRTAKQQATRLKCPWTVLYVENADYFKLQDDEKANIEKTLRLAEQLGATTVTIQEANVTTAILKYARENNCTRIIITKSKVSKVKSKLFGNLVYDIIDKSEDIDVYIINEDSEHSTTKRIKTFNYTTWWSYFSALFIIISCTLVGLSVKEWLDPENVVMIFLAGIVFVAATSERIAAMVASVLSVILYKFFFTEPYYSIGTYHPRDIVTLGVLLLTALVISSLTSQLRIQNLLARKREKFTADLYALSHKLIQATGKAKIAKVVSTHIGDAFESAVTVWIPDHFGHLQLTSHPNVKPELKEQSAAQWAFGHNEQAGLGTNTMPSARGCYLPLTSGNGVIGVLGVIPADPKKIFSGDEMMMLEALAIQTASALERSIQAEIANQPKIKTW